MWTNLVCIARNLVIDRYINKRKQETTFGVLEISTMILFLWINNTISSLLKFILETSEIFDELHFDRMKHLDKRIYLQRFSIRCNIYKDSVSFIIFKYHHIFLSLCPIVLADLWLVLWLSSIYVVKWMINVSNAWPLSYQLNLQGTTKKTKVKRKVNEKEKDE